MEEELGDISVRKGTFSDIYNKSRIYYFKSKTEAQSSRKGIVEGCVHATPQSTKFLKKSCRWLRERSMGYSCCLKDAPLKIIKETICPRILYPVQNSAEPPTFNKHCYPTR